MREPRRSASKEGIFPGAERIKVLEGSNGATVFGQGATVPGGVCDRGACGRDDLVNWEILITPP